MRSCHRLPAPRRSPRRPRRSEPNSAAPPAHRCPQPAARPRAARQVRAAPERRAAAPRGPTCSPRLRRMPGASMAPLRRPAAPDCPEPARRSASLQLPSADITAAPIGGERSRGPASCAPRQLTAAPAGQPRGPRRVSAHAKRSGNGASQRRPYERARRSPRAGPQLRHRRRGPATGIAPPAGSAVLCTAATALPAPAPTTRAVSF